MRSALPFLLFAAFSLPAIPASSAQAVNAQTGASRSLPTWTPYEARLKQAMLQRNMN